MNFKQIINIFLLILIIFIGNNMSYAKFYTNQNTLLEIKRTLEEQKQALNEFKLDKLQTLYTENYTSNDGHTKEDFMSLLKDAWKNHPDIKYDMTIVKIQAHNDYATVKAILKTKATTAQPSDITKDTGILNVNSESIFHVKKVGKSWKIYAEETLSEKVSLLYGNCKNMKIDFYAPEMVRANTEYTASLKIPEQYSKFAMGSIKNEIITYPEVESTDVFRSIDTSGVLERILKANNTCNNETTSAYVAFTQPFFNKDNNIELKVSGLALLMQRVNVVPQSTYEHTKTTEQNEE